MRLIDADKLYRIVKTECNKYGKPTICFECGNKVLDFIDNAPTVAVNCKDCDGYEAGYSAGSKDTERPQGDLISRNNLREDLRRFFPTDVIEGIEPKTLFAQIMHDIDNAPTINAVPMDLHEKCMDKAVSDYIECQENKITDEDIQEAIKQGYKDGFAIARTKFERPKGEWLENNFGEHYCSNCKYGAIDGEKDEILTIFCPHCGANMRGDDNG